jgi:hypothetical protein
MTDERGEDGNGQNLSAKDEADIEAMKHASPVHLERSEKRMFQVLLGMAGVATCFIAIARVSPEASAARQALCMGVAATIPS